MYQETKKINQENPRSKLLKEAKDGKESIGIEILDVVLSQSGTIVSHKSSSCTNYQPINYKEKRGISKLNPIIAGLGHISSPSPQFDPFHVNTNKLFC